MSYTALYRKLRPHRFADVVGQPHIVTTLVNQITSGRVSHAYLLCGTRGTGKTTTAKIFAQAVNCQSPQGGEPCGQCASCAEISAGRSMNVVEIDAASNNGVDNVREIRDEVRYAPTEGKYRIYIIDEVHMLSTGAFNALLKTLEEPPPHAVFILATTDPQKIPATVLSRVQRFDFRRISTQDMRDSMRGYMAAEGVTAEDDALAYIANASDGAMRDALSILDQCIAFFYGQDITLAKVLDVLGAVDSRALFNMTWALSRFDCAACLAFIDEVVAAGRDINQFATDMLGHFRNLLMAQNIQAESSALVFSAESAEKLRAQASSVTQEALIEYIRVFSGLLGDMRYAANQRVLLEVACVKLCNPAAAENSPEALLLRVAKLEADIARLAEPAWAQPPKETESQIAPGETVGQPALNEPLLAAGTPSAAPGPDHHGIQSVVDNWQAFAGKQPMPLGGLLKKARPVSSEMGTLALLSDNVLMLKSREQAIKDALALEYGNDFGIAILTEGEYTGSRRTQ